MVLRDSTAGFRIMALALCGWLGFSGLAPAQSTAGWKFAEGQWNSGRAALIPADGLVLAEKGASTLPIVVSDQAKLPEMTAAEQLRKYLEKISGAQFRILTESNHLAGQPAIFVGGTRSLKKNQLATGPDLAAEDWRIRVLGDSLFLYGGYPRGTLYAVFHLLEDELGVHWWTPESETVPRRSKVVISRSERGGRPAFDSRAIAYFYAAHRQSRDKFEGSRMVAAINYDDGLFAAQNRINNQGNADYKIDLKFGGELGFGPPGIVHTYFDYVDPKKHFEENPEWFSLVDGERRHVAGQLDVMNPALRAFFLHTLLGYIKSTVEEDALEGYSSRLIFDISPEDHEGYDEGEASRNLVEKEGTEMAPVLDLINELAGVIREPYPDIRLETLAYKATEEPPKTMRAADNVIITVADTASNPARALSAEGNGAFLDLLKRWKARARHLRVWDYANAYGIFAGSLPLPMARILYGDLRTYHELGVEGVLVEIGDPWTGADRDFLYWVTMKGMEDPGQDFQRLERTFTDGFFGPAGTWIRKYYALLEKAAASGKADNLVAFGSHQPSYAFLDLEFLSQASAFFDSGEAAVRAVTDDPAALLRVRKARLGLDEAILRGYQHGLLEQWMAQGGTAADFPLPIEAVLNRYRETLRAVVRDAVLPEHVAAWDVHIDDKILMLTPGKRGPMDFPGAEGRQVFDFLPDQMGWNFGMTPVQSPLVDAEAGQKITVRPVRDEEADAGIALELLTESVPAAWDAPDWKPMWSYFGLSKTSVVKGPMPLETITATYSWIKLGDFPVLQRGLTSLFTTTRSPVGAIWMDSDYYPEIYSEGVDASYEFWVKIRRVDRADRVGLPPVYRVSRAAMLKK